MTSESLSNVNVVDQKVLITPDEIKSALPISDHAASVVQNGRRVLGDILDRKDPRLFVVVGPCSIHDIKAAMEYAERLRELAEKVSETLFIVMRVYFEKPRTTVGWKGLINDPHMDDSFEIEEGLHIARRLLIDLAEMGLPTATEALDPIVPQYLSDLLAWSAIGARTTESQTHREMASGLSTPVGFKNGTDGNLEVATNAMLSVTKPHNFLGINSAGQSAIISTRGNRYAHIVLRGGSQPNYDSVNIAVTEKALEKAGLEKNIVVDCSHGNSSKDPALQPLVAENVVHQIHDGNESIVGLMLESNLGWGNQKVPENLADLEYGVSVTDACIDWPATESLLLNLHATLQDSERFSKT